MRLGTGPSGATLECRMPRERPTSQSTQVAIMGSREAADRATARSGSAGVESKVVLRRFFHCGLLGGARNPLAPTRANWQGYFDVFLDECRHQAYFEHENGEGESSWRTFERMPLVLGVHRSATSLLTAGLQAAGLNLGFDTEREIRLD